MRKTFKATPPCKPAPGMSCIKQQKHLENETHYMQEEKEMYWYNEVNKLPSKPRKEHEKMTQKEKLNNYKFILEQIKDTIRTIDEIETEYKYPKAIGLIQGIIENQMDCPEYDIMKHTHEDIKRILEEG